MLLRQSFLWRRRLAVIDRGSIDFPAAVVPDPYPARAIAQLRSLDAQVPRQFVGSRRRGGGKLEQHSAGVEDDVAVVEEIKEETRHIGHR